MGRRTRKCRVISPRRMRCPFPHRPRVQPKGISAPRAGPFPWRRGMKMGGGRGAQEEGGIVPVMADRQNWVMTSFSSRIPPNPFDVDGGKQNIMAVTICRRARERKKRSREPAVAYQIRKYCKQERGCGQLRFSSALPCFCLASSCRLTAYIVYIADSVAIFGQTTHVLCPGTCLLVRSAVRTCASMTSTYPLSNP